ncbi:MAG: ribose 5-phosphate isomerase B [Bacteroidetes bacterium]|nr:ribose 5-phosphate isomerase B [Bacteroidota bacterium]
MKKILALGSDHAGFELKETIKKYLIDNGFDVIDFGTGGITSVDYPDFAHPVASAVNNNEFERGILICGSGNGVSIVANKYKNVRAALCWNRELAELARQHNNANILSLPARFISTDEAIKTVDLFLNTSFEGGRHQTRIDKISLKEC